MAEIPSEDMPQLPPPDSRWSVPSVPPPHPTLLSAEELVAECTSRFQRRSGPGGQHRNKTSSGVFLLHDPSGVTSEATERRSQADNREVALVRLRYRLATELRTESLLDCSGQPVESERLFRDRYRGHSLRLNDANWDKPALLALVLNDLHAAGGQPSLAAPIWKVGSSRLVALCKSHPPALLLVNAIRAHHDRPPLK